MRQNMQVWQKKIRKKADAYNTLCLLVVDKSQRDSLLALFLCEKAKKFIKKQK